MTDSFDTDLVTMALERGYVSREQLAEIKRLQATPLGKRPVPQLLLEKGYLSMVQFSDLFSSVEEQRGPAHGWFGELAVRKQFITQAQLDHCVESLKRIRAQQQEEQEEGETAQVAASEPSEYSEASLNAEESEYSETLVAGSSTRRTNK